MIDRQLKQSGTVRSRRRGKETLDVAIYDGVVVLELDRRRQEIVDPLSCLADYSGITSWYEADVMRAWGV